MLVDAVEDGTGTRAQVPGYSVGGKTGTARKPQDTGTYQDEAGNYHYVAAFTGMVPAEDPELSIIVVIDEPTATIYGGSAAAPVFADLARFALSRFRIPPAGPSPQVAGRGRRRPPASDAPVRSPPRASRAAGIEYDLHGDADDHRGRPPHRQGARRRLVLLRPRQSHRRPRPRRAGRRRRRGGAAGRAAAADPRAAARGAVRPRAPWARSRARFYGDPSRAMTVDRHHRHQRQDHDGQPAAVDLRDGRAALRGHRHADLDARRAAHDPRRPRAPGPAGRVARRRRRRRGDGGLVARPGHGARRRHLVRGDRLHHARPRPPRPPPRHRSLLRGEGAAVRTGPDRLEPSSASDDPWGARLIDQIGDAVEVRPFALADAADLGPPPAACAFGWRGHDHRPARWPDGTTWPTPCARRRSPTGWASTQPTIAAGLGAVGPVSGRFELVDAGQAFTVAVDYAHTPDALADGARRRPRAGRARPADGSSWCSAAAATRTGPSGPRWGGSRAASADVVVVTSDNPRSEDPEAIIAEIVAGIPDDRWPAATPMPWSSPDRRGGHPPRCARGTGP